MHSKHRDDLFEDDASFEVDLDETNPDEIDPYAEEMDTLIVVTDLRLSEVMWVKGHDRARYAFVLSGDLAPGELEDRIRSCVERDQIPEGCIREADSSSEVIFIETPPTSKFGSRRSA